MELIFHEKQTGMLCAQHALNALLQGQYFSAVDLAEIARSLEEVERQNMLFHGIDPSIRGKDSQHYDDSGYFSFEVLAKALQPFDLTLIPFESTDPIAEFARAEPIEQQAYICNYKLHWFTIRKLGKQWFNLNSNLQRPVLISDTYLSLFLEQLRSDRYHVFIVTGSLPQCEADNYLMEHMVEPTAENMGTRHRGRRQDQPRESGRVSSSSSGGSDEWARAGLDPELQSALAESKRLTEEDDHTLQQVLDQSRRDAGISDDEWHASKAAPQSRLDEAKTACNDDESELMRAIAMSLDGQSSAQAAHPTTTSSVNDPHPAAAADSATVRTQRDQFLQSLEKSSKNN